MELTESVKEMVGKEYLFSGNFLDKEDKVEESYKVLKVRPSDYKIKKKTGIYLTHFNV